MLYPAIIDISRRDERTHFHPQRREMNAYLRSMHIDSRSLSDAEKLRFLHRSLEKACEDRVGRRKALAMRIAWGSLPMPSLPQSSHHVADLQHMQGWREPRSTAEPTKTATVPFAGHLGQSYLVRLLGARDAAG